MALRMFIVLLNDLINHEARKQTGSCLGIDVFYFFLKRFFSDIGKTEAQVYKAKMARGPILKLALIR